jgi:ABC-type glycerol-3-phosphate transport system substrate-binding protein
MKQKVFLTALLVLLPFFITACTLSDLPVIGKYLPNITIPGTGGGAVNKEVTLNVWGLWENPSVMDVVIKQYQSQHPNVKITYDDRSIMNVNDYKDTVSGRIAQKDAPDVVLMHDSWVPQLKGSLSPMPANLMSTQAYSQNFYPVASQQAVADGKIYAVPAYYDGLVLVYNKKHFADANQQMAPTGWEEFRTLASTLKVVGSDGNLVRAGAAIGSANNIDFFSDIIGMLFMQAKVTVPDTLDSKAAQDALTFYTNFVTQDKVWDSTFPEASIAFAQEKVSMIFVPTWNLIDILAARPDLDIGVAPVPQATPEEPVSWGSFWMYGVPSGSANKEAAWDFLNYLSSEPAQLAMFSEASKYRPYGAPYSLVNLSSQLAGNPYLKPLLDTAPFAKSSILAGRAGNKTQVIDLMDAVTAVLKGSVAADALKTAKDKILQGK